jgi:GTP-binding protein Era
LEELKKLAFESEHFFPEDTLTDQPERVLISELIREKVLHYVHDEIPHGVAVEIERMRKRPDKDIIDV